MRPISSPLARRRPSEEGYMLVAVMFLLAAMAILAAVAAPRVKESIQRDREVETMHRGKQYIRAIQLYYRKFHAYPPNLDALVKTQEIRFLRRKYIDPTTGKDEWKPVMFGQNKAPTAMGFFGQPMAGSSLAGIGPGGGNGLGTPGGPGSTDGADNSGAPTAPNSNGTVTSPQTGGILSNQTGAGTGILSSSSSDASGGTGAGTGVGGPGNGFGGGATFGGAGIIGFSPQSPRQSILIYKKKNHYNEWEFVYDPMADQVSGSQSPFGNTPGFGSNPNQPGFGGTQPPTQSPAPAPTPNPTPQPQQ